MVCTCGPELRPLQPESVFTFLMFCFGLMLCDRSNSFVKWPSRLDMSMCFCFALATGRQNFHLTFARKPAVLAGCAVLGASTYLCNQPVFNLCSANLGKLGELGSAQNQGACNTRVTPTNRSRQTSSPIGYHGVQRALASGRGAAHSKPPRAAATPSVRAHARSMHTRLRRPCWCPRSALPRRQSFAAMTSTRAATWTASWAPCSLPGSRPLPSARPSTRSTAW